MHLYPIDWWCWYSNKKNKVTELYVNMAKYIAQNIAILQAYIKATWS